MNGRRVVLISGGSVVPEEIDRYVARRGYAVRRLRQAPCTAEDIHAALRDVSGYLIGGSEQVLDEHIERATRLTAVAFAGTDVETWVPASRRIDELGVTLVNAPGANADAVAEFTILLILMMARSVVHQVAPRDGGPAGAPRDGGPAGSPESGWELRGRTIGIIGLGRIGSRVARIAASGFGMHVCYHSPRRSAAIERELSLTALPLPELLARSDVVTLHRPGPAAGPGFGRAELSAMRPGALLVNTVHPELVDLEALVDAIVANGLRAAFDGTDDSSPAWQRLLSLGPERFLATPTMAFHTSDANLAASSAAARRLCDALDANGMDCG